MLAAVTILDVGTCCQLLEAYRRTVVANRLLGGLLGLCNFDHSWVLTGPKLTIEFDASIENAKVLL